MAYNAPPGWYPDPGDERRLRWWDGSAWTAHVAPSPGPSRAPLPEDEASPGRWARHALIAAVVSQLIGQAVFHGEFRSFVDEITSLDPDEPYLGDAWGHWEAVLMQVVGAVGLLAGVLFLIWFFRSATNARSLGLPARRSPAAGVAGFMVPIINFWWPYQSTRDLLPEGHPGRRLVLRWFLVWLVGGILGAAVGFAAAFVESWWGWALLVIPAALVTLAGVAARQVIAVVVETHESLAALRRTG